jgi:hypothetical protein
VFSALDFEIITRAKFEVSHLILFVAKDEYTVREKTIEKFFSRKIRVKFEVV